MKKILKRIFVCLRATAKVVAKFFAALAKFIVGFFKRLFKYALVALVLLVLFTIFSDIAVKFAINHTLHYMDMRAHVETVRIRFLRQTLCLENITLKNPPGFLENDAFSAQRLEVDFDLFGEKKIKRLHIYSPKIQLEGPLGRRIAAPTILKSNYFEIGRKFLELWSLDLEEILLGDTKEFQETLAVLHDSAGMLDMIGEIRINSVRIQNGLKDSFSLGALVCHDGLLLFKDFSSELCDVGATIEQGMLDFKNRKAGFANFSLENPEGYPKDAAFSISKFVLDYDVSTCETSGRRLAHIENISVDSPFVRLECKGGSLLGALGLENNFLEIAKRVSECYKIDAHDLIGHSDEPPPEIEIFKLPSIPIKNANISKARLAGRFLNGVDVGKVSLKGDEIEVRDIFWHVHLLKGNIKNIKINSVAQTITVEDLSVKNTENYPAENAFHVENISMSTLVETRHEEHCEVIVVDKLFIRDFFVRLDSKSGRLVDLVSTHNNLLDILAALNSSLEEVPLYKQAVLEEHVKNGGAKLKKYIIKDIVFEGGRVLIGPKNNDIAIPLDTFELKNLGESKGGLNAHELSILLVEEVSLRSLEGAEHELTEKLGFDFLKPFVAFFEMLVGMFD